MNAFVSYLRVSTARQGAFGLGIDAQRAAVAQHVTAACGNQVHEFVEVESGTRKAEEEARLISTRTKAALSAAKARGVQLGNPQLRAGNPDQAKAAAAVKSAQARARAADVLPYVEQARRAGATSLEQIAAALTARGVPTPSGAGQWHRASVRRVMTYNEAA